MNCHSFCCLPAARAASCWLLNVDGSTVAVCIAWYSIFSLPGRTYPLISDGSGPSENDLQIGHSRSPKYWSVTGALGEPRVTPFCGMPLSRDVTSATALLRIGGG